MLFKKIKFLSALALSVTLLSACESVAIHTKEEQLNRVALPVFMLKRHVPVDEIQLVAYERVHDSLKVAQVYIEDNKVFRDDFSFADLNPKIFYSKAPANPVGLRLASQDSATNVIYLSAPCQYMRRKLWRENAANACINKYYSDGPVSKATINAYMQALDNVRRYHGVDAFVLNGFGTGASVAAILASQRMDVEGLRTVSGRLDGTEYPELKVDGYYEGSLNPIDYAGTLTHLPQYHFIGKEDSADVIKLYHNYAKAVGPTWCMRHSIIPDAEGQDGWVEQWSALKALPLNCYADRQNEGMAPEVDLTPVPFNPDTLDIMDDRLGRGKK